MKEAELPYQVESETERIRAELFHRRWLSDRGARKKWREVKIRGGCYITQASYGNAEVLLEVREEKIASAAILGADGRQKWLDRLIGADYCEEQVLNIISQMATR